MQPSTNLGRESPRILVVDDNESIHCDFRKILCEPATSACLKRVESQLFSPDNKPHVTITYKIESAYQGESGVGAARQAVTEGDPYVLAFIDMRMPPGWDGLRTIRELWRESPDTQVVVCTAYSECSWKDLITALGRTDSFLVLKKPFDAIEVRQLACALTEKWYLTKFASRKTKQLEDLVGARTAELRAQNDSLKHEVAMRKELQQQLLQIQKLEMIGQLAGGVAHDFNNLLTVINGRSSLILTGMSPNDPLYNDIQLIEKTGERAAALTRQLLAFGRGQLMEPRILNLNAVVADMEKMLCRVMGENVDYCSHFDPNLWATKIDLSQVEQVVLNLATNARDAMPSGGRFELRTENVTIDEFSPNSRGIPSGTYVLVTALDNGPGMDRATLARVFEPFFTTKPQGRGTGLGLATVYGIVKQSGGHIFVESESGRGTEFKIFLPACFQKVSASVVSEMPSENEGSEVILLVEDDDAVRDFVGEVLTRHGYRVLSARGGEDAINISQRENGTIHLMITDMVMPGMSGYELAKLLLSRQPSLKVLYMSGYTNDLLIRNGIEDGTVSCLQKPFSPSLALSRVRTILDEAS